MSASSLVLSEVSGSNVATITLNDPERLNAMSLSMATEFRKAVSELARRKDLLRAIILTGSGRAFSAGGDLEMLKAKQTKTPEVNKKEMLEFYHSFLGILDLDVPLIAALNGAAIGAGLCVAAACDIRLATAESKLGFTFTRLGLHPGMGATYFVPRVIGDARARELLLTGKVISASEALNIGLISKIVASEKLAEETGLIVQELLKCGPEASRQLVVSLRGPKAELAAALDREAECQSVNYAGAEFKEGLQAVAEKREAKW